MKFRLGFISNSSSSSYIIAFPKGMKGEAICKAKLRIDNPPVETLTKAAGYDSLREMIEEFLKGLKIERETEKETIYEISIPFEIFRTYDEMIRAVGYWCSEEEAEERYGKYRPHFHNYNFGLLEVSNESGDPLLELIYFLGFRFHFKLHPMLDIVEAD